MTSNIYTSMVLGPVVKDTVIQALPFVTGLLLFMWDPFVHSKDRYDENGIAKEP